ncbi:hypothetical protein [Legionella sp. PL877]|nr:hypothetical protein [Legionella sp. PL877]MDI9819043.1 hypothetical protein [Legionella sp. PL877]
MENFLPPPKSNNPFLFVFEKIYYFLDYPATTPFIVTVAPVAI